MGDTAAPAWAHVHHVAVIGVRGVGHTLAGAFEQAALAVTAVILEQDAVVAGLSRKVARLEPLICVKG